MQTAQEKNIKALHASKIHLIVNRKKKKSDEVVLDRPIFQTWRYQSLVMTYFKVNYETKDYERFVKHISFYYLTLAFNVVIYLITFLQYKIKEMNSSLPLSGKKIENYIFNYTDFLGNGNFSKCYKAKNIVTNEEVAIKIVELNSLKSKKLQQLLFSQIEVLKQLNHPNVLRCFEVFTSNRNCYIITQLCNEGDLENKIKKKQKLEEWELNNIIADVYKGLKYLESKNIIHRDLKIANIFMHNGVAKIADFGFALHTKVNFRDLNIGSPLYMSPEGILENIYGPKTDVWAFGIMIYQLYHGKTPFNFCQTEQELRGNVVRPILWNQLKYDIPNEVKQLILKCLQVREQVRQSISQLYSNPYLKHIVDNRDPRTALQQKFRPQVKARQSKLLETHHQDPARGRSVHMKMKSAFISSDRSNINTRQNERFASPNRTFNNAPQHNYSNANNHSVNSSLNFNQMQSTFQTHQNSSIHNLINIPSPQVIKKVSVSDRSQEGFQNIKSPVLFSEQALNSSNRYQNSQRKIIISGQLNFKESVSILHYCRLIFKYLNCFKDLKGINDQSQKQHYSFLGQYLILILDQVFEEVAKKKIRYEGDNPQVREKKLYEVTEQYRSKYNKQLDNRVIRQVIDDKKKETINLSYILQLSVAQSSSLWLSQKSSYQQIIVGELILVIYSSSLLLEECYQKKNYSSFQKYKEIQETLNKNKELFTFSNYVKHKNRVFSSKVFSPR